MKNEDRNSLLTILFLLILIPAVIFSIKFVGLNGATILLGIVAGFLFIFKASSRERRFMLILAIFSQLFENVNVAVGAYKYAGAANAPIYISLGWVVLGWGVYKSLPLLKKVKDEYAYAAVAIVFLAYAAITNTWSLGLLFSIPMIWMLKSASSLPASTFALTSLMGFVIEWAGTTTNTWQYFDAMKNVVPADLAGLGMAYAMVMAFCLWISGIDKLEEKS